MFRILVCLTLGMIITSCSYSPPKKAIKISSASDNLPTITESTEDESLIQDQFALNQETVSIASGTKGNKFFRAKTFLNDYVKPGDVVELKVDLSSMEVEGFDIYQYIKYDSLEGGKVIMSVIQIPILGSTLPTIEFTYTISETTVGDADATGFVLKYWVNGEQKEHEPSIEYRIKKIDKG